MLNALFSIKPKYAERIFSGEKRFEFRTTACKKQIDKIIIYETSPTSKIVGEVSVLEILKDDPQKIWEKTKEYAGIEYDAFLDYFSKREIAYAYVLENPLKYENPKSLKELNISAPPQSFIYIKDN